MYVRCTLPVLLACAFDLLKSIIHAHQVAFLLDSHVNLRVGANVSRVARQSPVRGLCDVSFASGS
jgi:hypothetical protein